MLLHDVANEHNASITLRFSDVFMGVERVLGNEWVKRQKWSEYATIIFLLSGIFFHLRMIEGKETLILSSDVC